MLYQDCVDAVDREAARQAEERKQREALEAERKRQSDLEERRVRALEEAARNANRPRTCTTTRNAIYPYEILTVCE